MDLKAPKWVSVDQWQELQRILETCLPGVTVWAFGSRVKGTARKNSDLDLVAFAEASQSPLVGQAREAFEESSLPFRVDLHVWSDLPESYQANIRQQYEAIQPDLGL